MTKTGKAESTMEKAAPVTLVNKGSHRLTPMKFVPAFGVVSILADFVYEGARVIVGPYQGRHREVDSRSRSVEARRERDAPKPDYTPPRRRRSRGQDAEREK